MFPFPLKAFTLLDLIKKTKKLKKSPLDILGMSHSLASQNKKKEKKIQVYT